MPVPPFVLTYITLYIDINLSTGVRSLHLSLHATHHYFLHPYKPILLYGTLNLSRFIFLPMLMIVMANGYFIYHEDQVRPVRMCVLLSVLIHCLQPLISQQLVLGSLSTTCNPRTTLLSLFGILVTNNRGEL